MLEAIRRAMSFLRQKPNLHKGRSLVRSASRSSGSPAMAFNNARGIDVTR